MKILLACGGTGGHLFPGIALAEGFEEKIPGVEIVFVGTPRGLEKEVLKKTHWRLEMTQVLSLADKKGLKKIGALFGLASSFKEARRLLKQERPDLVVATGGYAAGPIVMTASMMRIPTLTLEPNFVPGLTNRLLRPFVDKVVVANANLKKLFGKKTLVLGIPVRKNIFRAACNVQKNSTTHDGRSTIFIFGGSQGAKKINEGVLAALPFLKDLKEELHFIHQTGAKASTADFEKVYREQGFSAEVYPFIEEMGTFYARSSFVIARAGANTIAELSQLQIPSVLIPYPHSAAGHQEANARVLEKEGCAIVLKDHEVSGEKMGEVIRKMLKTSGLLDKMKTHLGSLGGAGATDKIVEACLELVRDV